jgi:hypothetical protein
MRLRRLQRAFAGRSAIALACGIVILACGPRTEAQQTKPSDSAELRAIGFLSREVPRWSRENHCFSCHNNGDAARALYQAASQGYSIPADSIADTTTWLRGPDRWGHNGGDGPFSDKKLARIAFSRALATAIDTKQVVDPKALEVAADQLAHDQLADGSWSIEGENNPGSPAAYGQSLATWFARNALESAGGDRFKDQVRQADAWLANRELITITDAAVALLAAAHEKRPALPPARAFALLKRGQSTDDGGWGPYVSSPTEIFDTALVLIALAPWRDEPEIAGMIARGRKCLIDAQQPDGSWIETTRPTGGVSYAQRISTTGWATLSLLGSAGVGVPKGR